ncbi:MAG: hypothetical protein JNL58_27870 [Planctomyces sp.]|nr:hypothetical protein [Planctomyces sp.]
MTFFLLGLLAAVPFIFLWRQVPRDCPNCRRQLPLWYAPWNRTRRQWVKGGFVCPACNIEVDLQGKQVSPDEPPISTAAFLRVLIPALLAPVLVLIVSYFAFDWGKAQIKSFMLQPETQAAETTPAIKSIPALPLQHMPRESEQEGLRARLVLRVHERQNDQDMYSLGLEIQNAYHSQVALCEFDPQELKLELLDANGKVIPPGPIDANGPVQAQQQVVVLGRTLVTLPVHDHGYGFAGRIWANDETVWNTPPGEYQVRGSVTVTASYGRVVVEGPFGNILKAPTEWDEKPRRVELSLPLSRFRLPPVP